MFTTILIWGIVALVVVGVGYFIFVLAGMSNSWGRHYDGYDPRLARDTDWTDSIVVNLPWDVVGGHGIGEADYGEYTGEVVDEEPHGQGFWFGGVPVAGIQELEEIEDYAKSWKDELLKGRTEFTFEEGKYSGNIYAGEFKHGRFDGQGTLINEESSDPHEYQGVHYEGVHQWGVYKGGFKDGKKNGQGTWDYGDGCKYVGEFRNDLPHGHGSFTYGEDGLHSRKHEWVDNNYEDGTQFVGEFMEGEPWAGVKTDYDKEGNVTKTITYSEGIPTE